MRASDPTTRTRVRETEILSSDTPQRYREKLARIALDEMYQFVAVLDRAGTLLEVNRAALEGAGLELADVRGKPFWDCFWWAVSPEIRRTLEAAVGVAAGGDFVRYDVEIYGRAGGTQTIIIDFSMIPVKDQHGQVVFIVPEGRDITEKKSYEQEIARKNADLQALLLRVQELDEIKGQFFANVSHELRTPLSLILGPASRLLDAVPPLSPTAQREAAQVIVRNARMLLRHVNDLLDISKLEAGKLKIETRDTDLAALVRFTASHFEVVAADRAIDMRLELQDCVAAVDAEKLQRVLMNLLSNAFKFVPLGGIVACKLVASDDTVHLSVEDSGPGVEPGLRKAVFERFRQGDGGADRQHAGTGLGLAIVWELIQMHKGHIEVLSSTLGGARFDVTVPARRLSPKPALPLERFDQSTLDGLIEELRRPTAGVPEQPALALGLRPLVLVVEDNPEMNAFVAGCLRPEYDVISARDGEEGLQMALRFDPALIVSDIMMPRVSGAQMIAQLRQHAQTAETPIVVLSAKADDELKNQLLESAVQDYLTKPFTERELRVRVRNLVAVRQAREALRESEMLKRQSLEANQDALRSADRRKDEFLATLAHELRNPLAPIRHAAQIIKLPQATLQQTTWAQAVIERQVEQMARLLDDLLDVARVTTGKLQLRKERLSLAASLDTVIDTMRPLVEARGHALSVDIATDAVYIEADPVRFAQIFCNLLSNSAKYTDAGGSIGIRASVVEGQAVIAVHDDGIGIAAELLPELFEMFIQAKSAVDRTEGGLGIGLSLVRGLVALHEGSVEARSTGLGQGSEFVVRLPLALAAPC